MARRALTLASLVLALGGMAAAQPPQPLPRTADGRPDLQGHWYFGTATPLERPKEFAGKEFLTAQEAADFEKRTADRQSRALAVHAPGWLDYGKNVGPDRRTSLIIDPPDGQVPPLTPEGRRKQTLRAERTRGSDGPENLGNTERCLVFGAGPPINPGPYNNNLQIVQTVQAVVIATEMIHDARIVNLDGRPPLPANLRQWLGSSRGSWDGDTLVVETTNFTDRTSVQGSDEHLRIIERFRLVGRDALRYEYTIDNPTAFTRPWTAALTMARTSDPIYEFACHEANYGMANILRAARFEEQERPSSR